MEAVTPTIVQPKKYSRQNMKTNPMGASVFMPPIDSQPMDDSNSPKALQKTANYQKFLLTSNDMSMYLTAEDSPHDVANAMMLLSPTATPVKWADTNASESPDFSAHERAAEDSSADLVAAGGSETAPTQLEAVTQTEVQEMYGGAEMEPPKDSDYSSDEFVTSAAAMDRMRAVVRANMNDESMCWTAKTWIAHVAEQLNITTEFAPMLKKVLKAIVIEEMAPVLSQTESQTQDSITDPVESFVEDTNEPNNSHAANSLVDSPEEATRAERISLVVNSLLSEDSVQWPVKVWMAKVAERLNVPELTAEDKVSLRELVYAAAEQLFSQTQDTPLGGDDFDFLDDIPNISIVNPVLKAGEEQSAAESDSFVSSEEENGDEGSVASGGQKRKRKNYSKKVLSKKHKSSDVESPETVGKKKAEQEKANEELVALKAIEEGMNARAQAVHELIYRDRDELESKQAEMRNKVLERIRNRINPHLKQINAAAIDSLKNIDKSIDRRGMLKDIVKVFVREDALAAVEIALKSAPADSNTNAKVDIKVDSEFVNLSDDGSENSSSDDEDEVAEPAPPLPTKFSNGGLRMGFIKKLNGNSRNRLKSELLSRAQENSALRLATKVGVASSKDLTDVLGYAESVRKTHAALKADQERAARDREQLDIQEKEDRRRQYRERLHAMEQDNNSEGEFDENDESFLKSVKSKHANSLEPGDELDDDYEYSVSSDVNLGEEIEEDDELDEDAQLAELEAREREMVERENLTAEKEALALAKAEAAAARLAATDTSAQGDDEGSYINIIDEETEVIDDSFPRNEVQRSGVKVVDDSEEEVEEKVVINKIKRAKNEKHMKMLMADAKKKSVPSNIAAFLDEEAEEEEEEGLQRGLMDFGFGRTGDKLEADEEEDANEIRKSDLLGVVDELSDGEGDEEEGARRRMEEERKQDRKLQMKILRNLAEGHSSRTNGGKNGRGHFGIDKLTKGDMNGKSNRFDGEEDFDDEAQGEGADFDNDEELQGKLLTSFTERAKARRDANKDEDSELESSDDESIDIIDDEDGNAAEKAEAARIERRLRKEKELIMTRCWMEKGRMKSALQEEGRKKRKLELLDLIGDLDAPASRSSVPALTEARILSRAKTMSSVTASVSQSHLAILNDIANLGNMDVSPLPVRNTGRSVSASNVDAPGSMGAPIGLGALSTPRLSFPAKGGQTDIGFAPPVLPPSLSVITHHPQIKKSLKRSATTDDARPLSINTRIPYGMSVTTENTPLSVGSNSNIGFPLSSRASAAPRSVRNGYDGNLADGSAAHCMGMAFGDSSMSGFPDVGASLSGFGSDSQSGIGSIGRKMSFRNTTASTVAGNVSARGPSPSSAVTVSGQAFVFSGFDSTSRSGVGNDSNSGFFGPDISMGGSNSNSGFVDLGSAPVLKRVKSHSSSTSLMGIAQNSNIMKRQSSMNSLQSVGRTLSSGSLTQLNKKSIQDTIGVSGKSSKYNKKK